MRKMEKNLAEKFKNKFRKNFISTLTSKKYKIPADTELEANIKWIEVSIIFDSTLEQMQKKRK